ncbi:hypothetical protein HKX48_005751 [Thoreauomyces humboldtii]|nr:hypothetical protein HKX48_005751 [Thoreauomyces humboldtii]
MVGLHRSMAAGESDSHRSFQYQNAQATIDRLELDNQALREYYERNLTSLREFLKAQEEKQEAARVAALKRKEEEEEAAAVIKEESDLKMALEALSDVQKIPRKQSGSREAREVTEEAARILILAAEKLANVCDQPIPLDTAQMTYLSSFDPSNQVTPTIQPAADVMAASSPPKEKVVRFADIEDEIQVVPRDPEPEPPAPLVPVLRAGRRTVSEATLNEESSVPSKKRKGLKAFFRRLTPSELRRRSTAVAAC